MSEHFKSIKELYGNAYVQMPNGIFRDLSNAIKSGERSNVEQVSFAYAYLVANAFMYKYTHYVDMNKGTYMQSGDIKELLGYSRKSKSVDKIIKKGGILEDMGLVKTTRDYPIYVEYTDEEIGKLSMREFTTINMIDKEYVNYKIIKNIVKNRNYEIKEPVFLFEYEDDLGTLYDYDKTHRVTIDEFLKLVCNDEISRIEILMYFYFKYRCYGLDNNMSSIALLTITSELGIGKATFYKYLDMLKDKSFIKVNHGSWQNLVKYPSNKKYVKTNKYHFIGV